MAVSVSCVACAVPAIIGTARFEKRALVGFGTVHATQQRDLYVTSYYLLSKATSYRKWDKR